MRQPEDPIKAAVVGASGYVGLELIRILSMHPEVNLVAATSREHQGEPLSDLHRSLEKCSDLLFSAFDTALAEKCDLIFFCLPHTESMGVVAELAQTSAFRTKALKIIDLGADFRIDPLAFLEHYGRAHTAAELIEKAVYGLPEVYPERVAEAQLIANPGCFAHCITLGLMPLALSGRLQGRIRVNAVTGSTGSGIKPSSKTHHPERNDSLTAYKVLNHQHTPEIEAALFTAGRGKSISLELVPVSGPFSRGIFATCFVELESDESVLPAYTRFAEEKHFFRLRKESPRIVDVRGSNFCDVSICQKGRELVVISAIDNLVKGAAGNAIQCMNLMYGLTETTGLAMSAIYP